MAILYNAVSKAKANKHLLQKQKHNIISDFLGISWRSVYRALGAAIEARYSPSFIEVVEYKDKLNNIQEYVDEYIEAEREKK